jgi:hypothetical protein
MLVVRLHARLTSSPALRADQSSLVLFAMTGRRATMNVLHRGALCCTHFGLVCHYGA